MTNNLMLTNIHGHTLFSLFQDNMDLFKLVKHKLETAKGQFDTEDRAIDNPVIQKVSQILSFNQPTWFKIADKHFKNSKEDSHFTNAIQQQILR